MADRNFSPLTLNGDRSVREGSFAGLGDAIRRAADLRIATAFRHNEHIDTASGDDELVREVAEFRVTYLVDDRWSVIGSCNLDARSLRINLEFFAVIQSRELGRLLDEICREHRVGVVPLAAAIGPGCPKDRCCAGQP